MKTKQEELKYTILVYPKIFSDKEEASKSIGVIKNNILDHPKVLTLKQIADLSVLDMEKDLSKMIRSHIVK